MKKADPNCDQCGGRGHVFDNHGVSAYPCHCLKEEPHKDNPALDMATGSLNDYSYLDTILGYSHRKPKRKRHILKRKKRV